MDYRILDIGFQPSSKKTLLVVDDEFALTSVIFDAFAEQFNLASAHNGREGLAQAEKIKPDLILLDVMMPDMNGIEVLDHLHANESLRKIPVIVTTAKGFDPEMVEMLKKNRTSPDTF